MGLYYIVTGNLNFWVTEYGCVVFISITTREREEKQTKDKN